uniref:Uncharacterized protein n=1 Tax=Chlamydomonas leiostraca TaxID=1034604 RepID=A0A7S0RGD3_9CHLO|mmetsp:Transcript_21394/g.54489  ORF Transcript_21394/g.54489 Transcript_21394/m.54489 type:complete len:167 (+) Transcript_21394:132-632(+)
MEEPLPTVTLIKGGVRHHFFLIEYDEAQGGGRLDKETTLGELGLASLQLKRELDGAPRFVPVPFDVLGVSRLRFLNGAEFEVSGQAVGGGALPVVAPAATAAALPGAAPAAAGGAQQGGAVPGGAHRRGAASPGALGRGDVILVGSQHQQHPTLRRRHVSRRGMWA